MYLIHLSTVKTNFGIYEITVVIVKENKKHIYTYLINSEFHSREFDKLYKRKRTHGKALAILNKYKIKNKEEK